MSSLLNNGRAIVGLFMMIILLSVQQQCSTTLLLQSENAKELFESSLIQETIDDIIQPSDTCKEIVALFGSAISNFTLCSVTNARPIHLCQWCIRHYLRVLETHQQFVATIDEKGNQCREYFTNLDRIEIVSDAFKYVHGLWMTGKCDFCFRRNENGTIIPKSSEDAVNFEVLYQLTKSCFDRYIDSNETCVECKKSYNDFNNFYIEIWERDGDNICVDIVDTMNTTREIWSSVFKCLPERKSEFWLHIGMGAICVIPVIFYSLAFLLSNVQESNVIHQRRLIETLGTGSSFSAQINNGISSDSS